MTERGPVRTCVASRQRHPREDLVRLVAAPDGTIIVDYRGKLPGRGVWVLPEAKSLAMLDKRKGFIEKKLGATLDVDGVRVQLREHVLHGVREGITFAAAAGVLIGGRDRLELALRQERVELVAVADDAAERTVRGLRAVGGDVPFIGIPVNSAALGDLVGRAPLAAIGAPQSRASVHLLRQLRRLSALG